ncbi:MAG: signal peptide peptidase SppA [Myxococcales bacterium]|nr:signal peptide peptidase SppA [Myxococcales bacterium]
MAGAAQIARRVGANLARGARRGVAALALPRRRSFWVVLRLTGPVEDLASPLFPFAGESAAGLLDVLQTLDAAAADPQVDGVLVRLGAAPMGWSKVLSLRRALQRVRERGKPVAAYADVLGTEGLLVASAADRLWLPEAGQVFLVGLRAESLFLRGLLDHLDVKADVIRIGSHKSAGDRFTRERMSPEEREQLEALVDDLFDELVDGLAAGRKLAPATVRDLIDRGPYHARAAVEAGLADACLYPDELEAELEILSPIPPPARPGPRRVCLVEASVYHSLRAADPGWCPLLAGLPHLAYVVARGGIHRDADPRGISTDPLRALLERIGRTEEIRGVVLRLDSPGGDGVASDLLWRAVSLLKREKPVVVSMGDVVASGAYYIAVAADALLAEAGTVTGSIGVVGGKINLEGLYRRLGVAKEGVERGARAGLLSEARGFTSGEREAVRREMSALYDSFLDRVARGRGLTGENLDGVAQGRVWSGARARTLGLVDALGGPLEALREAGRRAGLREDERVVVDVHPRRRPFPSIRGLLRFVTPP